MISYRFKIEGVTALLMHANDIVSRDEIRAKRKRMKGGDAGDDRSPPESWKGYLYVSDDTGNISIPSENLLACMLSAGVKVKVGGKETLKVHSQRIMFDRLDYDLLVDGKPISKSSIDEVSGEFGEQAAAVRDIGFRLHVKPCTVGTSKHIRVRPMFTNWSVVGGFDIEDDDAAILKRDALTDLFNTAGRLIGLGDWRPSAPKKPGQYGRFTGEVTKV